MRHGQWSVMDAGDVVPGDICALFSGQEATADIVILQGQAVVSEAMLTGEPKPIVKFSYDYQSDAAMQRPAWTIQDGAGLVKKHVVHAGCPVTSAYGVPVSQIGVNVPGSSNSPEACIGIVMSTGAQTAKGRLVRMVLFPTPAEDVFDKQLSLVFLFVFGLCCIFAASIFFYDFGHWSITIWSMMAFLAQCISPNLHASLKVAQVLNCSRLKDKGVVVVEPEILNKAGKVHVMCFDKTGTITKEHLDIHGVLSIHRGIPHASGMTSYVEGQGDNWTNGLDSNMQIALGCCHTLSQIENDKGEMELLGNQVEMQMFRSSGWTMNTHDFYSTSNGRHQIQSVNIVRQMAFDQGSQTSGVVVRLPNQRQKVLVKGSFEKMSALTSSYRVSEELTQVVSDLSKNQYYVITIGYKDLSDSADVSLMPRQELESGLELCGLLLFRNDVKEDSAEAISLLKKGATRTVMITGDSVEAGIGVARAVDILPPAGHSDYDTAHVGSPNNLRSLSDIDSEDNELARAEDLNGRHAGRRASSESAHLEAIFGQRPRRESLETDALLSGVPRGKARRMSQQYMQKYGVVRCFQGDLHEVEGLSPESSPRQEVMWKDVDDPSVKPMTTTEMMSLDPKYTELAISMPAFRNLNASGNLMYELAPLVRVYGRMRPTDKSEAVKLLQRHNLTVGMCGDGGNDTAALRTAHFGYALSDADASLVAPVSSKDPSLLRVCDTLCYARCTLATSLAIFMWSAVLGGTFPAFKIMNIWTNGMIMAEVVGVWMEYAIETFLVFLMALSKPLPFLTGYRPTQRLIGINVALRVATPVFVWIISMIITRAILWCFDWFEQFNARDMKMKDRMLYTIRSDAYQMEIDVFRMMIFYAVVALFFSRGAQVRQALWKNWLLVLWCLNIVGFMLFLLFQQNTVLGCFFR